MEIRIATEQDREDIAEVYTDAFFEDWKQLSHDKKKIARALKNGHILNNYVVAISDDKEIRREKIKYAKQRGFSRYIYLMYTKEK